MHNAWITDVRKLALLNCIFSFLSMLVPAGRSFAQLGAIAEDRPDWRLWMLLAAAASAVFIGLVLTFFWAIYRDRARIELPAHLRLIALGAVIVLLVIGIRSFGLWAFGVRDDWSFVTQQEWRTGARSLRDWLQNPVTLSEFAASAGAAAAVTYVFFLIALFRQSDDVGREEEPPSRLLSVVTKTGMVVAGLILAFLLIRVFATPYLYSAMRQVAAQAGRKIPSLLYWYRDTIRDLLVGACYSAAPFLVYMGIRRDAASQID
jgi:hypothetical protein